MISSTVRWQPMHTPSRSSVQTRVQGVLAGETFMRT